jgi:uncharacterized protein (TIRG00374 family)
VKGRLGTVVKLLLVVGLMALVFSSVHWDDRLVTRNPADNRTVHEEHGKILGPWDRETVEFLSADTGQPRQVVVGAQGDGKSLEAVPGLVTYWRNLDVLLFVLGALCYLATVVIAGTRWWWLLRVNGMPVSLGQALRFTWIGIFFNSVVPGQTGGDLIKALYLMKHCPGQRVPALVSVIVDRVLGLASLAILGAVTVLFALDRYGEFALAIWGVMFGVALLGAIAFSRRLRQLVKLKFLLEKLPHRAASLLKLVDQAVFFYRGHRQVIVWSLLAGIVNHVASVSSVWLIGAALKVGLPAYDYFVLVPVISIVSAIPLGPNGWGVGEWMYQRLFAKYGMVYLAGVANAAQVMGTRGVALSLLYRLHLTLWSLVGGVFVLLEKDRVTRADVQHEVELEEREGDQDQKDDDKGGKGTARTGGDGGAKDAPAEPADDDVDQPMRRS